jgi:hypothetical protein
MGLWLPASDKIVGPTSFRYSLPESVEGDTMSHPDLASAPVAVAASEALPSDTATGKLSAFQRFARSLSGRAVIGWSAALYSVVVVMVLFPPLYLGVSGLRTPIILGLPFVVFYYILNAVILAVGLVALFRIEDARGELDESRLEEGV